MTQHVPPTIPERLPVKIAFVGEAPSDEELVKNQPFVGPSGRIFNAILRSAGIERADCHITNAFDEKAPDNDCTPWTKDEGRVREARERLSAEFALSQPRVIVPLGGTALWMLTGHDKIATFRGAVVPASFVVPGAKLVPTFHPMAVQHQWKFLSIAVGDFLKAAKEADRGPEIIYPKRTILLEPSIDDFAAFRSECLESDLLSTDIETGWGQITCIGFAPTVDRVMCVPFVDQRQPGCSYWKTVAEEVEAWKISRDILTSPVPKLLQNGYYDASWMLKKARIHLRNYRHDTRLMHHNLYPELPKDLASMSASYTEVGAYKHWGGKYQAEKRDA